MHLLPISSVVNEPATLFTCPEQVGEHFRFTVTNLHKWYSNSTSEVTFLDSFAFHYSMLDTIYNNRQKSLGHWANDTNFSCYNWSLKKHCSYPFKGVPLLPHQNNVEGQEKLRVLVLNNIGRLGRGWASVAVFMGNCFFKARVKKL